MKNLHSRRNVQFLRSAVLTSCALLTLSQCSYAQTVTLSDFEGSNTFNVPGDSAIFTFTAGETVAGVTSGVNSLKVDMTTSSPDTASFNQLGTDYDNKPDLIAHSKMSIDVTNPGAHDLSFQFQIQGDNSGYVSHFSPAMVAPAGADKLTLTWDYSAVGVTLVSGGWWQNIVYANNPGAATTFYIDNFRVWGDAPVVPPVTVQWANAAGGNWGVATNWDPNTSVPNGGAAVATLGTHGGTITGSPTVTMNAPAVVRTLYLDTASGQGYTIDGANSLAINSTTDDGSIHVLSGQHTITAPMFFGDHKDTGGVIDIAAGAQLTITDFRTEWNGLAKSGDGTLLINNIKNCGFDLNGGTVKLTADATGAVSVNLTAAGTTLDIDGKLFMSQWWMSSAAGSTINLGSGGTISIVNAGGVVNSDIVGTGVIEVVSGGNYTLQGSASTFTGPINVSLSSTVTVNNAGALGDAANTVTLDNANFAMTGPVYGYGHGVSILSTGTLDTQAHPVFLGIISGGALTKMGTGTLSPFKVTVPGQQVMVAGGVLQIPANGTNDATSVMGSLGLDDGMGGTGSFDLTNNKAIIQSGDLATIRSQIIAGYNAGSWDGVGIVSSTALANPGKALGYADAGSIGLNGGSFGGVGVSTGNILLAYTLQGDSNLDFTVDSVDFGFLVGNYGLTSDARWDQGDYTYDGKVNSEDFNYIAGNFNQTVTFPAPPLGAAVPEPSAVLLFAVPSVVAGLRRRRR